MMFRYLIDRIVFGLALVTGLQIPKFIADYRQRVGGMLDQARAQLAQFQAIADQFHNGSLRALIEAHRGSDNAAFRAEASVIEQLAHQVGRLQTAYDGLATTLPRQLAYLAAHLDTGIAGATLHGYQPGLLLTLEAVVLAVLVAFAGSALVQLVAWLLRRLFAARPTPAAPAPGPVPVPNRTTTGRAEPSLWSTAAPRRPAASHAAADRLPRP